MAGLPEMVGAPDPEQVQELLAVAADPVVRLLEAKGYQVEGWRAGPDEFGPSVSLVLANHQAEREVDLNLAWVEDQPVAEVMIIRTPRMSVSDDFFLSLFLREKIRNFNHLTLAIRPEKPVAEEIIRVFGVYAELLQGPAAAILTGEAWEEGHYTDWTL